MIETDNKLKGKINSSSSIKGSGISVKGETGNGIEKIEKTNTEGLIDTYTIYYTDGTTSIFQVSNGGKGDKGDKPIKGVDYFTPAEVQDIQNNILDNVNQFSVEVVETLPIQNIKDHTIYFVPKTTAEQNDIYDEYIYINNSWEHIGTTEVDLSNYYNKTEVDTKVTNIENAISESGVIVSATEPTGANREKVWMQKSNNMLNFSGLASSQTINGLTITNNKDGSIILNGTTTGTISICISSVMYNIDIGKYYLNRNSKGSVTGGTFTNILYAKETSSSNAISKANLQSEGQVVNIDKKYAEYYLWLYVETGRTFTNYILKPQLEPGTQPTVWNEYLKDKKIYILNNNNVYEEFVPNEDKIVRNSNGTAIKFANGMMICTIDTLTGTYNNDSKTYVAGWTFPVAFAETPMYCGGTVLAGNSKAYSVTAIGLSNTSVSIHTKCLGVNGTAETCDRSANCIAIGCWK